ncbi:MAG: ATP-dependent sacrificial sulfur transferase LarE [Proteobacteria bacterium]|nr:ATP-dependent sacrificial sulfur transferase LarE [Pseudomonadota bacterium]MBU1709329.1 ATP-dependent sacrificial sulfur transferase LarE [Pseudomonadota bacterium]
MLLLNYEKLKEKIEQYGRVAVAFSGGVDSTLVLATAVEVLGRENVLGLYARTPLLPREESGQIKETADKVGAKLLIHKIDPYAWPEFISNPPDRCYLCKRKIYSLFIETCTDQGIPFLLDGTNVDDLQEDRPGLKAIQELGIKTPLAETSFTKQQVRRVSRQLALPTWDRPSSSCLATRIASGLEITRDRVAVVAEAEQFLHNLGYHGCRAKYLDKNVSIELSAGDIQRCIAAKHHLEIEIFFKSLGFCKVFLDLSERQGMISRDV